MPYKRECNKCGDQFTAISREGWVCEDCKKKNFQNRTFRSNYQTFRSKVSLLTKQEREELIKNVFD